MGSACCYRQFSSSSSSSSSSYRILGTVDDSTRADAVISTAILESIGPFRMIKHKPRRRSVVCFDTPAVIGFRDTGNGMYYVRFKRIAYLKAISVLMHVGDERYGDESPLVSIHKQ